MSEYVPVGRAYLLLRTVRVQRQRLERVGLFRKEQVTFEEDERHWILVLEFMQSSLAALEGQTTYDLGAAPKDSTGQLEHGPSEASWKQLYHIFESLGLEKPWWVDLAGTTLFDYFHEKQADLKCNVRSTAVWRFVPEEVRANAPEEFRH